MDTTKYLAGIYAIRDIVAQMLTGGLYLHKHEASAIRFFGDVAADPQSLIGKHPEDFELIQLGYLSIKDEIIPSTKTVLTGTVWKATQNGASENALHDRNTRDLRATR